ncbi:EF-hand and coiled-coil domain-containing protein 1-like [Coregonus clupeaformis]|uniref:EF-hand and coiled-coil domain-containing protein 1-like n=1 Tax=Coregonus clupeaformis TaxID=59861 RepID=UPI001E1C54B0|nr:EF-hand and coiled-coil domain-containing protein 1-like [Coregonus clupeaformis]
MKSSRGTVASPSLQSSPRAARQSEWLRSALAHHHCPDPGVENEIVVLATGIDQYLQEVFHHLVYPKQDDVVSAEDFTVLCSVLGLTGEESETRDGEKEEEGDDEEGQGICLRLPHELAFRDFHSRLCGYFRVRARDGTGPGVMRLPVTEETEHIEREIRLRWPRVRRRKCVSFDLTIDQTGRRPAAKTNNCETGSSELHHKTGQTEAECVALRELVEDLRSALQGSDARCLALEVALRRQRGPARLTMHHSNVATSNTSTPSNIPIPNAQGRERGAPNPPKEVIPNPNPQGRGCGVGEERVAGRRGSKDPILRELQLIRSSRDGQLEEAIRFNQRLEEELGWAYREARRLEGVESRLRQENSEIRRRTEEAREALREGLQKVRLIQKQAQNVPQLQSRVTQLETDIQEYRSQCTCRGSHASLPREPMDDTCLQRAVEGRAASDEEEEEREREERRKEERRKEERGREEGQCCLLEVKRLINRLHSCGKGCQNTTAHHLLLSQNLLLDNQNNLHGNDLLTIPRGRGRRGHTYQEERETELEKRHEEVEGLRLEVQMVDTERVRLSLLEEKLTDTLTLLLQLRIKGVSRRSLGKMLMDTLDVCSRSGHGPSHVLQVANAFCAQLSSNELLRDGGGVGGEGGGGGRKARVAVSTIQRTSSTTKPPAHLLLSKHTTLSSPQTPQLPSMNTT